jgi:hypothetical protein
MTARATLQRFLTEEAKFDSEIKRIYKKVLRKYFLPLSSLYKDIFPKLTKPIAYETIRKIYQDKDDSFKTYIITQVKADKKSFKKYTLTRMGKSWFISQIVLRCLTCKGKGCEYCNQGWLE